MDTNELTIIGRAERVDLPEIGAIRVPAKVDTGADASSIWASHISEEADRLKVIFFDPAYEYYSGEEHVFLAGDYSDAYIKNSFGHRELRYKVKMQVRVNGRLIRASFTLADRSLNLYPILIGRALITGKFLVDVSTGEPLKSSEQKQIQQHIKNRQLMNGLVNGRAL